MPHSATLPHYRQAFFSRTIIAWNHSDNSATLQHYRHAFFFKNYHSLEPLRQQHNKPPPPLRIPSGRTNASGCRTLLARCGTQTHVDPTLRFINTLLHLFFFDDHSVTHATDRVTNHWGLRSLEKIRVCTLVDGQSIGLVSCACRPLLDCPPQRREAWASAGGHHTSL